MAVPFGMLEKVFTANDLLEEGEKAEAAHILEQVYEDVEKLWIGLNDIESMDFLGMLAHGLRQLSQTKKEIRVLKRLCTLAERDLERLGMFATDQDIIFTGWDFVYLGLAYKKQGQLDESRKALEKAREIFGEIDWKVDVEEILAGKETFIGPKHEDPMSR